MKARMKTKSSIIPRLRFTCFALAVSSALNAASAFERLDAGDYVPAGASCATTPPAEHRIVSVDGISGTLEECQTDRSTNGSYESTCVSVADDPASVEPYSYKITLSIADRRNFTLNGRAFKYCGLSFLGN